MQFITNDAKKTIMSEFEMENQFTKWLSCHFSDSHLLIERDVELQLESGNVSFRVDILAVQSKSNILHTFEIKNKINQSNNSSIIWHINSMYGNYKWLVLNKEFNQYVSRQDFKEKGLGLILFYQKSPNKLDFEISIPAKYIDGNLLKYYPSVSEKWSKKIKHGRHCRTEKKN